MGGLLSGRRGWRRTIEGTSAIRLDVNAIMRAVRPGMFPAVAACGWHSRAGGLAGARITLRLDDRLGSAQLDYWANHPARRIGPSLQTLIMESTPCRFGGKRWWWVCPVTGRRCAVLFLPNGGDRFLSRQGWRLAYACQAETPLGRCHRRLRKLRGRMGGDIAALPESEPPPRPRWMREATYGRLVEAMEMEQGQLDAIWIAGLPRCLRLETTRAGD